MRLFHCSLLLIVRAISGFLSSGNHSDYDYYYNYDDGKFSSLFDCKTLAMSCKLCNPVLSDSCPSGKVLTKVSGVINTELYPYYYADGLNCSWTIQVTNGMVEDLILLKYYYTIRHGACLILRLWQSNFPAISA